MLKSFVDSCGGPVELHPYQGVIVARDPVSGRHFLLPDDFISSAISQNTSVPSFGYSPPVIHSTPVSFTPSTIQSDQSFSPQATPRTSRTPTKRRRWTGPVAETVTPAEYRAEHMLWGTTSQKHRIGLSQETGIPRPVSDARNHFRVSYLL